VFKKVCGHNKKRGELTRGTKKERSGGEAPKKKKGGGEPPRRVNVLPEKRVGKLLRPEERGKEVKFGKIN